MLIEIAKHCASHLKEILNNYHSAPPGLDFQKAKTTLHEGKSQLYKYCKLIKPAMPPGCVEREGEGGDDTLSHIEH